MDLTGEYKAERKEAARFMRRLYRQKLTTTSGGNISLRVSDKFIAITASATDKGTMKWKDVCLMDLSGKNLTPSLKPSIESGMHISIYKKKKDVAAIIHAHPVYSSAFTAMKRKIYTHLTAEACAILGTPAFVPYALMGTKELAEIVSESALGSDILLLENHGILATGTSLLQAFDKIEVLENAAKMTMIVELSNDISPLSEARITEIEKNFRC